MSAWKEWQIAEKNGNKERAEESRRDFMEECRREEAFDRMCEMHDMYEHEYDDDEDE